MSHGDEQNAPEPQRFSFVDEKMLPNPNAFFILSHVDDKMLPNPNAFLFLGNVDEQHVPEPQRFLFLISWIFKGHWEAVGRLHTAFCILKGTGQQLDAPPSQNKIRIKLKKKG